MTLTLNGNDILVAIREYVARQHPELKQGAVNLQWRNVTEEEQRFVAKVEIKGSGR
jgi:phage-related protein